METKTDIIQHYKTFNKWVHSLLSLDKEQWLQPIKPKKWSTGEIVSHFIFWDRYFFEKRLPLMKRDEELPQSTGTDKFNEIASQKARTELSKETIIRLFLYTRTQIIESIEELTEEELQLEFYIGGQRLSLSEYINELIEHDVHHQKQIEGFLA